MTGLKNRRGFVEAAVPEIDRARRHNHPFTVALIDLDDFKLVNDGRQGTAATQDLRLAPAGERGSGDVFNVGQPRAGMKFDYTLKSEGVLYLRCDVHPWMTGYVGVVSHPYFAVTADDGAFHLANVPPGHYTLEAWHERFGILTQAVDVTKSRQLMDAEQP